VASYPFSPEPGPSLVFLSRMSPEKAPHLAIEAARRAGRTLLLMGELQPQYEGYFHREVEPRLDGRQFRYLGSVPAEVKRRILAGSVGLLAPVQWPEPFGLFLVESLACGTPVIAFDRGAVPEIIEHGRTGFVVNSLDEMVAAVDRLPEIDRRRCRQAAERRFDAPRMAEGYLRLYERILSEGSSSRPRASRPSEPSVVPLQELGHVA
jgi:glycosyltransferase involved in cell wall biosynthesis